MAYIRDLGSVELWQSSIDRSRRRRAAARHRRRIRRLSMPLVVAAAAAGAPATALAGSGGSAGGRGHTLVREQRTIRPGSVGAGVVRLQRLLGLAPDGRFGPSTEAAVRRFQRADGLAVDGVVGPRTWSALVAQDSGRPGQASVVVGDRGPAVVRIQRMLGVAADGDFGPVTLAAVLRFQRSHGLVVDGQVGPFTIAALAHAGLRAAPAGHHRRHHRRHHAPAPASAGLGARVVALAREELGVRYTWGGGSPATGFDCSGLVEYVFARLEIALPHNAAAQYGYGSHVARDALRPGDLVFFDGLGHVAIYLGGGEVIAAPHTGTVVQITPLAWAGSYVGATRIG